MKRRPILTILGALLVVLPSVAFPQYITVQKVDIVRVSTPIAVSLSTGGVVSVTGSTVSVSGLVNVTGSTVNVQGTVAVTGVTGSTVSVSGLVDVTGSTVNVQGTVGVTGSTVSVSGLVDVTGSTVNVQGTVAVTGVTGSTVTITGYNVQRSTYIAFTVTSNGSQATAFDVASVSVVMEGGTGSGLVNLNSGDNVVVSGSIGYSWNAQGKRYVNPTVNYTVSSGTMVVVVEGYIP